MKTIVLTSDTELWALRPFSFFLQKYYPSADVLVAGFTPPTFSLPYGFLSLGAIKDFPYQRWSNGLIELLNYISDEIFVLLLEDFWVTRTVDAEAIEILGQFMRENEGVARCDLSTDRLYGANVTDIGTYNRLDLITNNPHAAYTMSFQPGIHRRTQLLKYLIPNENPHEVELRGTERMIKDNAIVVGTRNFPMRVLIAVQQGKLTLDGGYQSMKPLMHPDDFAAIGAWIPLEHP